MKSNVLVITRKIQLLIDSEDREFIIQAKEQLYNWQRICFRSANMIMSHQFIQEQVADFFYLTQEIKMKIADQKKDENGILVSSRQNTTYRLLSNHFKGKIPTNILSNLNNTLISYFNKEKDGYWKGEKSLRNYKRNIPLPFGPEVLSKFTFTTDNKNLCFRLFQIPFRTYLGKDKSDKMQMLKRIMSGDLKLRTSQLQLDKGKVFLLAAVDIEKDQHSLDAAVIAEAALSIEHPVTIRIGIREQTIGSKEEFLHRRLAIQAAIHRVKIGAAFNRGGHGKKRKMKGLEDYKHMEKRYVEQKLHLYSRMVIDFCIKYGAGTILLVNQQQREEIAKGDAFLLKNWSYYSLKEKISYKAEKAGIQVIEE
ncbi:transposase [Pedobacter frigidisoli]|uniref:Transposase n=1 Tax=Pedobacter frigidisoli TaxID=2530455 RepID=A0A4R0P6G8_9SPHI|nr:transposase [Pedobacter frigidisoli]TCD11491.1 transposase [Pedobacter frigidisoli]